MTRTTVILGAGVGGLVVANSLRKTLPKGHRVILIDREESFVFAPSFLWVIAGKRTGESISRPLKLLERKGIEVVRGTVERIDPDRREVVVAGRSIAGDFVVIALGVELTPEAVPGLAEAGGYSFYTLAGAEALRDGVAHFAGRKIVVLTAGRLYKSPGTPYEAAMLLASCFRRRGARNRVSVELYVAESSPMALAGSEVSVAVLQMVVEKGVIYHPGHELREVDAAEHRLRFTNGVDASFDLLAYVPPHVVPGVVREAGLTDESGWIPVDAHTLQTRFPGVYALGDVTTVSLGCGKSLPKAGVFAHREAEVVAKNIAFVISGKGRPATFNGDGAFFLETGNGAAAFGSGKYYAEPLPQIKLHSPGRHWHVAKVLFEKEWFRRWF